MPKEIELPNPLSEELYTPQIAEKEIQPVVVSEMFTESAMPFTQRLIEQNRELFESLAKT